MSERSKYIGKFTETDFEAIDLPFSIDSLKHLLTLAVNSSSYSHQQITDWANRFWWDCMEGELSEQQSAEVSKAADIAQDMSSQWDMSLYDAYSLEQLQHMNFSQVKLPQEWFEEWQQELDEHLR